MQPAEQALALWQAGLLSDGALADWMDTYLSANAPTTPLLIAIHQHALFQGNHRLNGALLSELLHAHSLPKASFHLMLAYQLEGLQRGYLNEEAVLVFLIRQMNNPDCPPFMRHAIEQAEICWIDLGDKAAAWQIIRAQLAEQQRLVTAKQENYRQLVEGLLDYQRCDPLSSEDRSWMLVRET